MTTPSTAHIDPQGVPIAETILLPGDPLRAQFIAETFLDDVRCCNRVRNMLGFTGTYRGTPVSVMGTGMGIPSIALYSHELIHTFGVRTLIRVGSCGAMQEGMELFDLVIAQGASTDSSYLRQFGTPGAFAPLASYDLLSRAVDAARDRGQRTHVGNVLSSDVFHHHDPAAMEPWRRMGILAVEMESAGLYANAAAAGVQALGMFAVSDSLVTGEALSASDRETAFAAMVETALALLEPGPSDGVAAA